VKVGLSFCSKKDKFEKKVTRQVNKRFNSQKKILINYLLTKSEVFMGNLKPRPCCIDLIIAIAQSIWQGRVLRFSHEDQNIQDKYVFFNYMPNRAFVILAEEEKRSM